MQQLQGGNLMLERLLEPGSTAVPNCICDSAMRLSRTEAADRDTEIRIFRCPKCAHELRLTIWNAGDA
jgi:hypothetical protein